VVFADATDLAALEHPQQPRLQRPRQFADLVQKQCAAVGDLEEPGPMLVGAREGAAAMTEQLAFDEVLRQRAAVHRDEGPRGAAAPLVNRAGDELLARPRLPAHEHRRIARSHAGDEPTHRPERDRITHELRSALRALHPPLEGTQAGAELPLFPDPFEHRLNLGELARLRQVVEDALPHRRHGALHR